MTPTDAAPDPAIRSFVANRGDDRHRLDLAIARHLADDWRASRTRVQRWVSEGRVHLNGAVATRAARPLNIGDQVEVRLPSARVRVQHVAEALDVPVLFEDEHLMVVSKPPGMLVHPTGRHRLGTLFNALLWHAQSWTTAARPGLVHRLDRDTSGVLLVAKSRAVHARAVTLLRSPRASKRYLALVVGHPPDAGAITTRLCKISEKPPRVGPAPDDGWPSETRYRTLTRGSDDAAGLALLECTLMTGRLHQIRAHLHGAGWPIVGDPVYGPAALPSTLSDDMRVVVAGMSRQALHAWQLTLPHPVTGELIAVSAPLPSDLSILLTRAGMSMPPG